MNEKGLSTLKICEQKLIYLQDLPVSSSMNTTPKTYKVNPDSELFMFTDAEETVEGGAITANETFLSNEETFKLIQIEDDCITLEYKGVIYYAEPEELQNCTPIEEAKIS